MLSVVVEIGAQAAVRSMLQLWQLVQAGTWDGFHLYLNSKRAETSQAAGEPEDES